MMNALSEADRNAISIADCPDCGSIIGALCIDKSGNLLSRTHDSRRRRGYYIRAINRAKVRSVEKGGNNHIIQNRRAIALWEREEQRKLGEWLECYSSILTGND